ncbi:Glutamyl-tRNA(Gln) amidotransferase subunit A [Sphingobium sp. AntQ-1]|uniref:amidase n=1 Tax=Sphingobium sp. AntQ-1 TaxID=2930091 RepID=UPI00234F432E|nr:amidase [Sphingobium sp. AntQ-1]WCP13203.1 Glutamyl-tRNA(Gln) amidotransferase subunit A [Sphingobium sp. AntQ-1]
MKRLLPILALLLAASPARAQIEQATVASLSADLAAGRITSQKAVRAYLQRIAALDRKGPRLNSIISLNPHAMQEARVLDAERRAGKLRGPLHGVPILLKDNIEAAGMPTTAGSLALARNDSGRDSSVAAALKAKGAIILGKTNLSEWANFRSERSMSGWSAIGGLTRNPYALDRTTCGSSSGSGAAVAAGFAPAAIGSETNGSIICPASMMGLVGLKPTVGLIPRTHIVPISHSQDTAGPMARSVRDVAILLSALIASDPADPATADAMAHARDYAAALDPTHIKGARIGVLRGGAQPELLARYEAALALLKGLGATLVEVKKPAMEGMSAASYDVLQYEFKADVNAYLASTRPDQVESRTLADLIVFDDANKTSELPLFGQEIFVLSQAKGGLDDPAYKAARETSLRLAGKEGIDAMLADNRVDLLVTISYGPAWPSDTVWGDQYEGPGGSAGPAAIAGYPHLTVPMGLVRGLPVGLSFIGAAYAEQRLLDAGYVYEQAAGISSKPDFRATVDSGTELEGRRP